MSNIGDKVSIKILDEIYCGMLTMVNPYFVNVTHRVDGNNHCIPLDHPFEQRVENVEPCRCENQ